MIVTPSGVVRLLYVPLDKSQTNQIYFSTRAAQTAYFASKTIFQWGGLTFTRQNNTIRIPAHIDTLYKVNYVMYDNNAAGSRWFYAFIDRLEYASESTTLAYIKTDVYQTWYLDCVFKQSFVIREHVDDDTIGLHTVPENVDTGDLILSASYTRAFVNGLHVIVAVTETEADGTWTGVVGNEYGGIFSGCKLFAFTTATAAAAFLTKYLGTSHAESVVAIWQMPDDFITYGLDNVVETSSSVTEKGVDAPARPAALDGYTPKNNKLLTYPYVSLFVHNNSGGAGVFKYEDFNGTPHFHVYGSVLPNPALKIYPANLRVAGEYGWSEGLTLSGFPLCSWANDTYKTWLAQNAGSLAVQSAGAVASIVGGVATSSPFSTFQGVMSAANIIAGVYQHSLIPDQMRGSLNAGDANNAVDKNDFFLHVKTVKAEYAAIIDEYLTMYGYKVARVKVPAMTSRSYWNFVQTSGANIVGDIQQDDLDELRAIFDKGVTLWHSGDNVGNYSLNNTIVSE